MPKEPKNAFRSDFHPDRKRFLNSAQIIEETTRANNKDNSGFKGGEPRILPSSAYIDILPVLFISFEGMSHVNQGTDEILCDIQQPVKRAFIRNIRRERRLCRISEAVWLP